MSLYKDPADMMIINLLKATKKLKINPNTIFSRANKRNITMALDRLNYLNKIKEMLNDTDTYIKINKEPIKKFTLNIRKVASIAR